MVTALATLFFGVNAFAKLSKAQEAAQWESKATQVMDICLVGSPPFRLTEDVKVWTKEDKWVEGTYTIIWGSPDQWNEELTLPNYHEIRVGGQQSIWSLRSQPHWTAAALHAWPLVKIPGFTARAEKFGVNRIYETKAGEITSRCFFGKPIGSVKAEECFDVDHSFFLSSTDTAASGMMRTEFGDYFKVGEHFIPRQRRQFRNGHLVGEVHVRDASLTQAVDPAMLAPPLGAMRTAGCQSPVTPKPITMPDPAARRAKVSGTVALEVRIDPHGSVEDAVVVESLAPSLDNSVVETIKKGWRFEPATCLGAPVPFEMVVEVDFLRSIF
jgi:TonB family protein